MPPIDLNLNINVNENQGTPNKVVADIAARDAIVSGDRSVGLLVLVLDATDDSEVETGGATYMLKSGLTNSDWEKISNSIPSAGGEGVKMTITPTVNLSANRLINASNNHTNEDQYGYAVTTAAATSGNPTDVIVTGIALVEMSEDCYAGDEVIGGVDGKGKLQTGSYPVCGITLEDGNTNDVIKVKLK